MAKKSDNNCKPIRVLHCLTGAAGQPYINSRALRKIGVKADCALIGTSKYDYGSDLTIELGTDIYKTYSDFIANNVDNYDIFHFYFRSFFLFDTKINEFPNGLDLLILRAGNKKVVFHYRGSEVRIASTFQEKSPFNYVMENPSQIFNKFPEATVKSLMQYIQAVSHAILVPDPELQTYVPNSEIFPRSIDLEQWQYIGQVNLENPLIVHAPTRRIVKGTQFLLDAIDELREEGMKFRFELIENMTNEEAMQKYREADIVVDQLRIGWYGVLAVENMALGKAVVSYIRDDLIHHLGSEPPIAIANPNTVKEVLRKLIQDPDIRTYLGNKGRKYCEENHDSIKIAQMLKTKYIEILENPKPLDFKQTLDFMDIQYRYYTQLKKLIKKQKKVKLSSPLRKIIHSLRSRGFWRTGKLIIKKVLKK